MLFGSALMMAKGGTSLPWWRTDPAVYAAYPFGSFGTVDVVSNRPTTKTGTFSIDANGDLVANSATTFAISWPRLKTSTTPRTMAWWQKCSDNINNETGLVGTDGGSIYTTQYTTRCCPIAINNPIINCNLANYNGYSSATAVYGVSTNDIFRNWHHYASTTFCDGVNIVARVYYDGLLRHTATFPSTTFYEDKTSFTFNHGRWTLTMYRRDIILVEKDFTAEEIAELYAVGKGNMWV